MNIFAVLIHFFFAVMEVILTIPMELPIAAALWKVSASYFHLWLQTGTVTLSCTLGEACTFSSPCGWYWNTSSVNGATSGFTYLPFYCEWFKVFLTLHQNSVEYLFQVWKPATKSTYEFKWLLNCNAVIRSGHFRILEKSRSMQMGFDPKTTGSLGEED